MGGWSRREALQALAALAVGTACSGSTEEDTTDNGLPRGSSGRPGTAGSPGAGGGASGTPASGGAGADPGSAGLGGNAGSAGAPGCSLGGDGTCQETAPNILGPYYKADAPYRNQLTTPAAGDTRLVISGTVYGCDCVTPLADATVDVWQANTAGEYDNTGFELRGRIRTDAEGRYSFETIVPGQYLNGPNNYRPSHIHYRVSHGSVADPLITQLYFAGDPWLASDPYVRESLIITLDDGGSSLAGRFDIVLA